MHTHVVELKVSMVVYADSDDYVCMDVQRATSQLHDSIQGLCGIDNASPVTIDHTQYIYIGELLEA